MLTLQQLLDLTPTAVRRRTANPRIRRIKDKEENKSGKKYRAVYTRTAFYNAVSTGNSYTLIIRNFGTKRFPNDYKFRPSSLLWVHCSCPYFLYNVEVALTLKSSSSIYDSNGALPRIKNPTLRPYLCKHLFATVANQLKADGAG